MNIKDISKSLWVSPNEKNWEAFYKALKKSDLKYYKVVYADEGKLNKAQDLTKSFVELYDSKYAIVTKVPLFVKTGNKVSGATKYLIGLSVSNRG